MGDFDFQKAALDMLDTSKEDRIAELEAEVAQHKEADDPHSPEAVVERIAHVLQEAEGGRLDIWIEEVQKIVNALQPGDRLPNGLEVCQAKAIEEAVAAEREACAKLVERAHGGPAHTYASENADLYHAQDSIIQLCARLIRARKP